MGTTQIDRTVSVLYDLVEAIAAKDGKIPHETYESGDVINFARDFVIDRMLDTRSTTLGGIVAKAKLGKIEVAAGSDEIGVAILDSIIADIEAWEGSGEDNNDQRVVAPCPTPPQPANR